MTVEERYQKRYKSGNTPWDVGRPDFNLMETVRGFPITACKALEIGCGSGDNSIWLAGQGFVVVGADVSGIALDKAGAKALEAKVDVDFRRADFLRNEIEGRPFGLIFDRGCFHSYDSDEERKTLARNAADHLEAGGLWLSLSGSADESRQGPGPPQRTAMEIVKAVESFFEILELKSSKFESNSPNPPRAWRCLMRKRRGG